MKGLPLASREVRLEEVLGAALDWQIYKIQLVFTLFLRFLPYFGEQNLQPAAVLQLAQHINLP